MKRWTLFSAILVSVVLLAGTAKVSAEWMWTPESGKWISEKNIEKKSAMLLYEQAQGFEQAGDIPKALGVYRKLIRQYPASSIAPDAQYWVGHLLEEQGEYYKAFKEYQKVIENYPSYKKFNEILEREYQIGNLYLAGEKLKLMGVAVLPAVDKSVEIFESIVRVAPYSPIAPRAQFNIGEAYRKIRRYSDAIPEYQKVVENYPESDLALEARYQIGQCSYQKTLKASYDQTGTDIALDSMQTFVRKHKDSKKSVEMQQRMDELVQRKAKKSFNIAEFYRKSRADEAAIIYYQDVIDNFPQTELAKLSAKKIDEVAAKPSRKKIADKTKEVIQTGEKKGMLAGLWPFGKKPAASPQAAVQAPAAKPEASVASASAKKPGLLGGLWPFGKKQQAAPAPAPVKGQKPFWAFWVKEPKKGLSGKLDNDVLTPSVMASKMKLPDQGGSRLTGPLSAEGSAAAAVGVAAAVAAAPSAPAVPVAVAPVSPVAPSESASSSEEAWDDGLDDEGAQTAPAAAAPQTQTPAQTVQAAPKAAPPAPVSPDALQVKAFEVEQDGSKVRLIFETNGDLEFKTFYLKDPSRILVSFAKGVHSKVEETIAVNKQGVLTVRQHFRSREAQSNLGKPLNAVVVDLDKSTEVKVYNDLDSFIIEVEKS